MGRRSINTTKSGKYMNPTDQARKEARKKELKKNKRQRQMVRAAVLKGKDPALILEEMEKIDEMEYNVFQPSPLNEKVLREKRKKLKETFDRVMRLYHNDDPELWAELKRKEVDYEKKRLKKQQYYESVKSAQSVQIDDIPLPQQMSLPTPTSAARTTVPPPNSTIHFPPFAPQTNTHSSQQHQHYNKQQQQQQQEKVSESKKKKETPGCPPGPPPDLSKFRELDSDADDDDIPMKTKDDKRDSGQNIDQFMKEIESVHNKKEAERSRHQSDDEHSNISDDERNRESSDESDSDIDGSEIKESNISIPLPPIPPPPGGPPTPHMGHPMGQMFRPPPIRPGIPGMTIRMPPGPPPGRPGMAMPRLGVRMPPGPPPGMPRMMHHQKGHHQQLNKPETKGVTTITAKPQIRNLSADVTRFVPSALRVKRDDPKSLVQQKRPKPYQESQVGVGKSGAAKDDAYMQFMKEMQGLL